jgi:mannose-1-phosphate guanylyltransferase
VLAGGPGSRLWPWSRQKRPKPVLEVVGGVSLIAATVARLPMPPQRVLVVTGPAMLDAVRRALPDVPADNVVVEPSGRNTAPAVALGVAAAARRGAEVVGVFPSDHHIDDVAGFRAVLAEGLARAAAGGIGLVGIAPDGPDTRYGYLRVADGRVLAFVEKPDRPRAEALLAGGDVLWNGGMFLGRPDVFARAFATHLPATSAAVEAVLDGDVAAWSGADRISFDHGVLEHHEDVFAVRGDFGWSDLGTWEAVAPWLPETGAGRGLVAASAGEGAHLVVAPGRRVLLVGLPDAVVVDDGEVLMVAARDSLDEAVAAAKALAARDEDWG